MSDQSPSQNAQPPRAIRLTMHYDGDKLTVLSRQEVTMATPPSDPVRGFEGEGGFWVEVRDGQGQTVYRRILHPPSTTDVEVFDPDTGIKRQTVAARSTDFTVVVPVIPGAQSVTVMSSPVTAERRLGPAAPVADVPLLGENR